MNILNFGSCNIDYVYQIDHMVRPGETLSTKQLTLFPGGKGLNQSVALAKAGVPVYHAGCLGPDSHMLREVLTSSGADISYVYTVEEKTGHAIIQVDSTGENAIFLYAGANSCVTRTQIDEVLSHFGATDLLLLQNEICNLPYLIEKAYERGMTIVLNPAPFTPELRSLPMEKISWLILNEMEAAGFSCEEDTEAALTWFSHRYPSLKIVLTLGKRGAMYVYGNSQLFQPAFSVTTVDTTAAGDTFIGYFLAGMQQELSLEENLQRACAASALAVSRRGAATSIPTAAELKEAMPSLFLRKTTNLLEKQKQTTLTYLSSHLRDGSLQELARVLNYSPSYTSRWVHKHLGLSFSQLLCRQRLKKAKELLETTDLSVYEIIRQVGYENETFFRKQFRQVYGTNPSALKKDLQR